MRFPKYFFIAGLVLGLISGCSTPSRETGFVSLFDGETLKGWKLVEKHGEGYGVKDGVIFCARGGGGNLFTEKEYSDFILRFEFKPEAGGNNGLGIRAPLQGDAAYVGMELQILDDATTKFGKLRPEQLHGSVYDVIAPNGKTHPRAGDWNQQEVQCIGRRIKVILNGETILETDLNQVTDPKVLAKHPGLLRDRGHIGFLGHNDYVEFRNIRIKDLSVFPQLNSPMVRMNRAPEGFQSLFNGTDLTGWRGLVELPKRLKMSPQEEVEAQAKADALVSQNWKVENGMISHIGKGFDNLCTVRDFIDFELLVDWKIAPKGDSGLYLRGSPQVQIWDESIGSGGFFNNEKNPSKPSKRADHFAGEWNRFRILMQGEKVTVFLNNELVVHNVTLENYWDRTKPVSPFGPIELQAHRDPVSFRNIFIRELRSKTSR